MFLLQAMGREKDFDHKLNHRQRLAVGDGGALPGSSNNRGEYIKYSKQKFWPALSNVKLEIIYPPDRLQTAASLVSFNPQRATGKSDRRFGQ